jgi:hypothetical protein
MHRSWSSSPLTERQMLDEYFIEHRTQILDIAAFLDRLDRARDLDAEDDFRLLALRGAVKALGASGPSRVGAIQLLLSDRQVRLQEHLDRKSAVGASEAASEGSA